MRQAEGLSIALVQRNGVRGPAEPAGRAWSARPSKLPTTARSCRPRTTAWPERASASSPHVPVHGTAPARECEEILFVLTLDFLVAQTVGYCCAKAADQGEAASLMPERPPSGSETITLGQAKLMGITPCSTRSVGPSAASASMTSR